MPDNGKKPLSLAIQELESGQVKIVSEEDVNAEEMTVELEELEAGTAEAGEETDTLEEEAQAEEEAESVDKE